jgi:hypothetical protein
MSPVPKRRREWYNPISIVRSIYLRPRVYLGAGVGIALLLFMPGRSQNCARLLRGVWVQSSIWSLPSD